MNCPCTNDACRPGCYRWDDADMHMCVCAEDGLHADGTYAPS